MYERKKFFAKGVYPLSLAADAASEIPLTAKTGGKMYKRHYEKPSVNVFDFDDEDVITMSSEGGENEKNDFDMWRG